MAFLGTFDHTLDAKKRLTIPSTSRAAMADGVVLAQAPERCIAEWPAAEYERKHHVALKGLDLLSPSTRELKRRLVAGAFDTELGSAHRVMVPAKLAEHAGVDRDGEVIGADECLEVWDRASWYALDEDTPTDSTS